MSTISFPRTGAARKNTRPRGGGEGLYGNPPPALPVAAFLKYPGVRFGDVVAPLTGHGLKANEKMLEIASKGRKKRRKEGRTTA